MAVGAESEVEGFMTMAAGAGVSVAATDVAGWLASLADRQCQATSASRRMQTDPRTASRTRIGNHSMGAAPSRRNSAESCSNFALLDSFALSAEFFVTFAVKDFVILTRLKSWTSSQRTQRMKVGQSYCTSMVDTLSAGSVMVSDEPLTGICCTSRGWIGFWPCAEDAVIWYTDAVPESVTPFIAVTC
jgi:hypothetical protein